MCQPEFGYSYKERAYHAQCEAQRRDAEEKAQRDREARPDKSDFIEAEYRVVEDLKLLK